MSRHRIKITALKGPCPVHTLGDDLEIHDGYRLERSNSKALCLIALDTIRTQLAQKVVPETFVCTPSCSFARGGSVTLEARRVDPTDLHTSLPAALEQALQARAVSIYRSGALERVVLPSPPTERSITAYYQILKHYSFRLLLRDVIKAGPGCRAEMLTHYCNLATAQRYLTQLATLGIVLEEGGTYRLANRTVDNLGSTLEWFIATAFQREFGAAVAWDVRMKKSGKGGDYDCLALLDGRLLNVELKSSPPKNIHQPEITEFIERIGSVQPTASILIVDTQLRLEDKVNKMVTWALRHVRGEGEWKAVPRDDRYFTVPSARLYILNSKPDLLSNLTLCLKDIASQPAAPPP